MILKDYNCLLFLLSLLQVIFLQQYVGFKIFPFISHALYIFMSTPESQALFLNHFFPATSWNNGLTSPLVCIPNGCCFFCSIEVYGFNLFLFLPLLIGQTQSHLHQCCKSPTKPFLSSSRGALWCVTGAQHSGNYTPFGGPNILLCFSKS